MCSIAKWHAPPSSELGGGRGMQIFLGSDVGKMTVLIHHQNLIFMFYVTEQHYCDLGTYPTSEKSFYSYIMQLLTFAFWLSRHCNSCYLVLLLLRCLTDKVFVLTVNFSIYSTVMFRVQGLHFWIVLGLSVRDRGIMLVAGYRVRHRVS